MDRKSCNLSIKHNISLIFHSEFNRDSGKISILKLNQLNFQSSNQANPWINLARKKKIEISKICRKMPLT
jgi:hypothetical protein